MPQFRLLCMKNRSEWYEKIIIESEKKIKGLFDDYRRYFNNTMIKPILLLMKLMAFFPRELKSQQKDHRLTRQ